MVCNARKRNIWLINCAFVGQKNFDIIEMNGATTKIIPVCLTVNCLIR
jgi:hypothetical protein